jgi:hypothetical protein
MSLGGLFIETRASKDLGSTVKLEFLVQEGQIRADGVVKRVNPGRGLALKFTAVSEQDRPRLAKLMLRSANRPDSLTWLAIRSRYCALMSVQRRE